MSAIGKSARPLPVKSDPALREVRSYSLRYDRAAGGVLLVSAILWIGLLLHLWLFPGDATSTLELTVQQWANSLSSALLIVIGLIGVASIDAVIGIALIRQPQTNWPQRAARLWAVLGLVAGAMYYIAAHDFVPMLFFAIVQGLILILLSRSAGVLLIYPSALWLGVFFLIPLIAIFGFSLGRGTARGTVDLSVLTLDNYLRIISPVGVSGLLYLSIILRTVWIALLTTILCLLIGYPFAFWLARQPERVRNALLLLVMIPFWTSILVRTYAWLIILRKDGLLNGLLMNTFTLMDKPLELTNTPGALLLGMVYDYLPYMVLPLYSSIEHLDPALIDAANDLYANPRRVLWRVILPLTTPGIIAGSILVFIPAVGTYVVSNVLGGGKVFLIGNLLEQQFIGTTGDKAFGAAFGFVLMVFMLSATVLYFRLGRRSQ
ncbi:MAG: ABC transporter permease [Chloroflexota bacterium]